MSGRGQDFSHSRGYAGGYGPGGRGRGGAGVQKRSLSIERDPAVPVNVGEKAIYFRLRNAAKAAEAEAAMKKGLVAVANSKGHVWGSTWACGQFISFRYQRDPNKRKKKPTIFQAYEAIFGRMEKPTVLVDGLFTNYFPGMAELHELETIFPETWEVSGAPPPGPLKDPKRRGKLDKNIFIKNRFAVLATEEIPSFDMFQDDEPLMVASCKKDMKVVFPASKELA